MAKNKGADQTARMHRLVGAFVVCKQQSKCFSRRGIYDVEAQASWPLSGSVPGTFARFASDSSTVCLQKTEPKDGMVGQGSKRRKTIK